MRSLLTALLLLLLVPAAYATETHKKTITTESIEVEPESLGALVQQSAIVVRVRILESQVRAFPRAATNDTSARASWPDIRTEHRVQVLDVYKCGAHHRAKKGDRLDILQFAGRYENVDAIFVIAGETPFMPGEEYVLFLNWNDTFGRYQAVGRFGTFAVARNQAIPSIEWERGKGVDAIPVTSLARRIRAAAVRKESE